MDSIGFRLKQFIEEKELSAIEFSEQVGIQRSSLSHLYSGRNKPSIDLLLKIKNQFPEIDLEWLITGEHSDKGMKKQLNPSAEHEKFEVNDVTDVNYNSVITDNQLIESKIEDSILDKQINKKSVKVLVFYNDGTYEEFNKSEN